MSQLRSTIARALVSIARRLDRKATVPDTPTVEGGRLRDEWAPKQR